MVLEVNIIGYPRFPWDVLMIAFGGNGIDGSLNILHRTMRASLSGGGLISWPDPAVRWRYPEIFSLACPVFVPIVISE